MDRVIHAVGATKVPDVTEPRIDPHSDPERVLRAGAPPPDIQFGKTPLHLDRHPQARLCVLLGSLGFRVAEEDQNGIADESVDRAPVLESDGGHLGEVFIEERGHLLRLQALRSSGKILDVRKEDGQLLALSMDGYVLLAAEDALVDLGREIPRDLPGYGGEELVGRFQVLVDARDHLGLAPLQGE
jgi:hypothetical protein